MDNSQHRAVIFGKKGNSTFTLGSSWGRLPNYGTGKWSPDRQQWSHWAEETENGLRVGKVARIGGENTNSEGAPEALDSQRVLWSL